MPAKTFTVPSINCGHCANTIKREVGNLPGVSRVTVDVESKMVSVEWSEPTASWDLIKALLAEINYPPED